MMASESGGQYVGSFHEMGWEEAMESSTFIDKSTWGDGPWQDEPDRVEWRDGELVGLIKRVSTHGAWCGYVGVPPGHPWHGRPMFDPSLSGIEVHGGVTYAAACEVSAEGADPRALICHIPAPGEPEELWWIGFDCNHGFTLDFAPARSRFGWRRSRFQCQPSLAPQKSTGT
jgi:hypothetical protein